jgi:hypothetical protein
LAACGGGDDAGGSDPASLAGAQRVSRGERVAPQTWPLTGLPAQGGDVAQPHPVMVLKMDNTSSSAPQQGLGSADLVVEELVEGGLTRLAAFFYSDIPGTVGPVRSMRASDIGIVSPVDAAVVTSGAAPVTIGRIKGAGIPFFSEGSKGFFRDSSRYAPYNLFTNLSQTATLVRRPAARPADYLPWGSGDDLPQGRPARSLEARFSSGHASSWTYADGHYRNTNTYAAAGDEFVADNVLVLRVQVGDAGYRDPAGNPVPETKLEGQGPATLFTGGRAVQLTWSKAGLDAPIELRDDLGSVDIPAGHTWIELVPAATGSGTIGG